MDKYIVITGAGSGMGSVTAQEMAKKGYSLILIGRRKEKLNEVKDLMKDSEKHLVLSVDICDKVSLNAAFKSIQIDQKNIVGLFANAGIGGENTYGEDDRWGEIINTNLTGTYNSIMELLPHLKKSNEKYKNIVITSSCLARFGVPNYTAYCASKAGLLGLTRSLAVEYASDGILVNSICPGWVDTEMARQGIQLLADRAEMPYQEMHEMQMGFIPTGKMSDPQEIANLVSFLLSNQETSITGQGIDINNGSWMG